MWDEIEQVRDDLYRTAIRDQIARDERLREIEELDRRQEYAVEEGKGEYIDVYV